MYPFSPKHYIINTKVNKLIGEFVNKLKTLLFTFIITFIFIFVAFVTYNLAEPKAYDFMTKHILIQKLPFDNNKKIHGSDDIVLVIIDSKTVEKYRWPWKRDLNCKIFEYFLKYANEKVLVHDSILVTLDKDSPESDRKFFNTINKFDNLGFLNIPLIQLNLFLQ